MSSTVRLVSCLLVVLGLGVVSAQDDRDPRTLRRDFERLVGELERHRGPRASGDFPARVDELRETAKAYVAAEPRDAVELLIEDGMSSRSRHVNLACAAALAELRDARAKRDLADAFEDLSEVGKVILAPTLAEVPGDEITRALSGALRERDVAVKIAVLRALKERGTNASSEEGTIRRALRDDARAVQFAAADALEAVAGERPRGYDRPGSLGPHSLTEGFAAGRIAILLDTSEESGVEAYLHPFVDEDDAAEGEGDEEEAGPTLVSPYRATVDATLAAVDAAGESVGFRVWAYDDGAQSFGREFQEIGRREREDLVAFLDRSTRGRHRDVVAAVREAVSGERPDEVHLFMTGLPTGRTAVDPAEVVEDLADVLWGTTVVLHVTLFEAPPEREPTTEVGRVELARAESTRREFVTAVGRLTGGSARVVGLSRPSGEEAGGGDTESMEPFAVDLSGAVSTRDLRTVEEAFEAARAGGGRGDAFLEEVAACPDEKTAELALEALRDERRETRQAVLRGLARNASADVHRRVFDALDDADTPEARLRLLHAIGAAPGGDVTAGLVRVVRDLEGDARRIAWAYLASRPAAELAAESGSLSRVTRGLEGLTQFYANTAQAKANGVPAPPQSGLTAGPGAFLPERYVAKGVAFVIDTQRDMEERFWTPEPSADEDAVEPEPASRLDAAVFAVQSALRACGPAGVQVNVIPTSGRAWERSATSVERESRLEDALEFTADLRGAGSRDVWGALEQALDDSSVEVVYLLVSGLPLRGAGSRDPEAFHEEFRALNARRGVAVHVIYVLGPATDSARGRAARQDQQARLDALYKPIAEESGGTVQVGESLPALEDARRAAALEAGEGGRRRRR